ncbi:translation initiation factor IF-1 [Ktedonobacter sp. SOSP1-85]|uniref:Translation initiation factor IF-1 n=1 Tax=Ktedonobacter racemifer DSM 44963 TaxID=485913 RepID=D6TBM2_KTERA|nr:MULTISPECIES: translation initiation factor IF-1 [Ktedonobacter]EFH88006.1 translation initiation factor IF-1 [Ktedonobacter racemifer DSM 44963]GHO64512.1 translation initiation factor IF-1 [Ktedonobacter sp. SOSP1-52]GHO72554.1 translation initiation factor IF-1 [Ktedonobacter sp. SOSP1-85]
MAKERDDILVVGEVVEVFPNALFKIQIDEQHHVLAVPAGRLRLSNIRLVAGDKVRVALSPYDLTRGRITWRINEGRGPR